MLSKLLLFRLELYICKSCFILHSLYFLMLCAIASWIAPFKRSSCPHPWNLWKFCITWQTGIWVADENEVNNWVTLKWGDYPGLVEWVRLNHVFLIVEEAGKSVRRMLCEKDSISHCSLWRCNRATSQEMWAASGNWKRQENKLFVEPSERSTELPSPCF